MIKLIMFQSSEIVEKNVTNKSGKKNAGLKKKWEVHKLFDVPLDALTIEDLHDYILYLVKEKKHEYVLNVNINCFNIINSNPKLKNMFQASKLTFLDGDGVRLGLRLLGMKSPAKITYARWIKKFAKFSSRNSLNWYLLGDTEITVAKARVNLKIEFPDLKISGTHHGFFDINESENVINDINMCSPDILIVGMGMPRQELWLLNNWDKIPDVGCALTGGAVLKYLSGEARQTPSFFSSLKLEWFFRFLHDPSRLFKRYFIGNILFFVRLILWKIGIKKHE